MISLVHKIVSIPAIYDLSQKLAGGNVDHAILNQELSSLPKKGSVLDVGGGTGLMRAYFPKSWDYTCLDIDKKKLCYFKKRFPTDKIILSSALSIPKPKNTYDCCILSAVSHHLESMDLETVLKETFRVLRPGGYLVFIDALLNQRNKLGMVLWALDRGRFPRSLNDLKLRIEKRFIIKKHKVWKVFHENALFICKKDAV